MITLEELQFISDLRKELDGFVKEVKSDDFDESKKDPKEDDFVLLTEDEHFGLIFYSFFNIFQDELNDLQFSFISADELGKEPQNFNRSCQEFIKMAKFIIHVLELTSKVFEEKAVIQRDFDGLLEEFNRKVVKNFLPVH